ncbi:acyl-CoA thioesterase [Solitalea sp. MAHUQ-68]|uniref:Acyl-CoA thioesterase n=1 Tax=Solitalea agri TaxID=2953739 RepID=A0A9X2JDI0_9SPHI|nr:acyl-CoA thioesterase [Solitalea agri]MCO4294487.1 acyl-CoA thioesterase [Solitalea agri]
MNSATENHETFYPVKYSQTTITELMIPSYANFGGKIHGGILLSLMDKVAYACASRHAGTYCVTVSVDEVNFLAPVEVGDLVSLHASVNYVGKTSLVVGIRVESENVKTRQIRHTNTSYFTMVAKDEQTNKPKHVPGLILEDRNQVRRCIEAIKRKEITKRYADEFDNVKNRENLYEQMGLLDNERCKLNMITDKKI